jgi:hypothetical protein
LIGASVQENPNHVSGTPTYTMQRVGAHPSTYNIPDQWQKAEEYYYWEGGYFAEFNTEVLVVEETVGPNGSVNSYDAPRPMSWYRFLPQSNSRVFYTALGHAPDNFTSDVLFRTHIKDALTWLLGGTTDIEDSGSPQNLGLYPNPATDVLHVTTENPLSGETAFMIDATGRVVREVPVNSEHTTITLTGLSAGSYFIRYAGATAPVQIMH